MTDQIETRQLNENADRSRSVPRREEVEIEAAQKTVAELREIRELTNAFLYNLCHYELRQDQLFISRAAELLLTTDAPLTEKQRDLLSIIIKKSHRMQQTLDCVVDVLRVEGNNAIINGIELHLENANLRQVITDAITDAQGLMEEGSVPDDLPNIWADPTVVRQIMVDTASFLKGGSTADEIVLSADFNDDWITIRIKNSNLILADETLREFEHLGSAPTLFSVVRFEVLHLGTNRFLVRMHGGEMAIDSREGAGTNVILTLPIPGRDPPPTVPKKRGR